MESLSDTLWDVVISGTGISQSLLALALSRSGKNVLHVDKNDYYGGSEAALSLQEVEAWVVVVNNRLSSSPFQDAQLTISSNSDRSSVQSENSPKLGFSRAYSLSLSSQLIYTRSNLLPAFVSSKVYRQLEFLAVGSWWVYNDEGISGSEVEDCTTNTNGKLQRIPGGREDVFADKSIDLKSKRSLMKFLKLAVDVEAYTPILEEWGNKPFPEFLASYFGIPPRLQSPLMALTLSPNTPTNTLTSYALPKIHRHLTSIGIFGPGFGSVIPKWGGISEIAQVACRASAVGGGVYVLNKGIECISPPAEFSVSPREGEERGQLKIRLQGGEEITTRSVVGTHYDLNSQPQTTSPSLNLQVTRSITIVSSPLSALFSHTIEGAPPPAGAVVVFSSGSLKSASTAPAQETPAVYFIIHSSDTGECPDGQCVIYASVNLHDADSIASKLLDSAVQTFLQSVQEDPATIILWSLRYTQNHPSPDSHINDDVLTSNSTSLPNNVIQLPSLSNSLAIEDSVLEHVKLAWEKIVGSETEGGFMMFEDREGIGGEEDDAEET